MSSIYTLRYYCHLKSNGSVTYSLTRYSITSMKKSYCAIRLCMVIFYAFVILGELSNLYSELMVTAISPFQTSKLVSWSVVSAINSSQPYVKMTWSISWMTCDRCSYDLINSALSIFSPVRLLSYLTSVYIDLISDSITGWHALCNESISDRFFLKMLLLTISPSNDEMLSSVSSICSFYAKLRHFTLVKMTW